ncbi:dTDP-4-dehydrorhamnose 3,5-epimerase [Thiothrix eikelboomii]|uniref:dTDP-4-dehydrorhamnose 3,5-epimerase n=1 Tax=Thiothrix eikelboomii TaxID=92487 RepID=A0A1T4XT05_9GAMM|nr:dTDP-4-dehydrorhamnose 3,5-epimerase [Thiothrix eikelboomii]SKA92672.1 dTDP-4-dehydrorhamnose 3,5-epimerase [Thiothrix eikelboomii]
MKIIPTSIPEVLIIEPRVFGDERGFFMETWNQQTFAQAGLDFNFVQDNHSRSRQGILRGLHYQIQKPQGKLVRVTQGRVYDVAVDLRRSSPTFGQWTGVELSAENYRLFWVPPGFAHGFYVLSESADFQYKCTHLYSPEYERCLRWDDPALNIPWPLVKGEPPQLSAKDAIGAELTAAEVFA